MLSAFADAVLSPAVKRKRTPPEFYKAVPTTSTSTRTTATTSSTKKKKRKRKRKPTTAKNKRPKKEYVDFKQKAALHPHHDPNIDLTTCLIPPRTVDRVSIHSQKPLPAPITGFTFAGKERLAVLTSNYSYWLVHIASACALRRVQLKFKQHPFPVPHAKKTKTGNRGRKNRTNASVEVKKVPTHEVEILNVDIDCALFILQNDEELDQCMTVKDVPLTVASAFLLHHHSMEEGNKDTEETQQVAYKTVNSLFLRT